MYMKGLQIRTKYSTSPIIKLDLGSGDFHRKGFIGIDLSHKADIPWDLGWGIPFRENTVDIIRSDHFFEHLDIDNLIFVLKECHRVLKPKGVLDITVPHIDPYIEAYLKKDLIFLKSKINDIPIKYENILATPFDIIMWLLYRNGDHKVFFDRDSIVHKLKISGFKIIKERRKNKKIDRNIRYSSIYITAIK